MQTGWVLRNGEVVAAAELAESFLERSRGLIGRRSYEGAMILPHTRSIHSFGVRFPLDVAFLDRNMVVLTVLRLRRFGVTLPRLRASQTLEARAGCFERWGLRPGDALEFRATS
jgi:uncharacterized membrane protein (UPF0127 family)